MLTQYKNINEILNASASISVDRLPQLKRNFVKYDKDLPVYFNTEITTQTIDSGLELHVYNGDTWITGNHKVAIKNSIPQYIDPVTNETIQFTSQPIAIDVYDELSKLNLTS